MQQLILIILIFMHLNTEALDLGTFGQTFKIIESDLLIDIQNKLAKLESSGELKLHQTKVQQKIIENIKRPSRVANLSKASAARIFLYDPSIKVPYDLFDHKGQIFAAKGQVINPLVIKHLTKQLLFIDGDDLTQVEWSINQNPINSKIILVNGAPFALAKKYKRMFYFDQHGVLVKKFGILHIPARVSQKNHLLQIEEIVLANAK